MRKIIFSLGIGIFILAFLSVGFCSASESIGEIYSIKTDFKSKEAAVFEVVEIDNGKEISKGIGFFVNHLGTAYSTLNVVSENEKLRVKLKSGKKYMISELIAKNDRTGVIKFKVSISEDDSLAYLKVAKHAPYEADDAFAIGISPEDHEYTFYDGMVSTIRLFEDVGLGILTSIPVFNDLNGAPMLNAKGNVIGMFSLSHSEKFDLNFALSLENFDNLKAIKISKTDEEEFEKEEVLTYEELVEKYGENYDKFHEAELKLQPLSDTIVEGWNQFHQERTTSLSPGSFFL